MRRVAEGNVQKGDRGRAPFLRLLRYGHPLNFTEGLMGMADEKNWVIASNKRFSREFVKLDGWPTWKGRNRDLPLNCWTGTVAAYKEPGKKLNKYVEYFDFEGCYKWVFAVPKEYQNEKNAILVAEHPNYTLEMDDKKKRIIVQAAEVDMIERFPSKNGWYMGDEKHDIPAGDESSPTLFDARRLYRTAGLVGPINRTVLISLGELVYGVRDVHFNICPASQKSILIETWDE